MIVTLPPLHQGQQSIDDDPTRHKVIVAGRRFGKTRLAVRCCLRVALGDRWWRPDDRRPGRAWWVAPTYAVTDEGWEPLKLLARQIPGARVQLQKRRIDLPNGGRIEVRSADRPEMLVGAGLDFVVLDEAGRMKPEAWHQSLRPTLTDRHGAAMFISTPRGFNWLWDLWEQVPGMDGWARFRRRSIDNPFLDPVEVEAARRDLGSVLFAQEYEAEFVGITGGIIDVSSIGRFDVHTTTGGGDGPSLVFAVDGTLIPADETARHIVVDPALSTKTQADYTVAAAIAITADHRILVLDVVRDRIPSYQVLDLAEQLRRRWDAADIWIEATAYQAALVQDGQRRGLPVRPLRADKDKITRALPLAAAVEAGRVYLLRGASWLPDLVAELQAFPEGGHDDQVDVLAYGVRLAATKREWVAY